MQRSRYSCRRFSSASRTRSDRQPLPWQLCMVLIVGMWRPSSTADKAHRDIRRARPSASCDRSAPDAGGGQSAKASTKGSTVRGRGF